MLDYLHAQRARLACRTLLNERKSHISVVGMVICSIGIRRLDSGNMSARGLSDNQYTIEDALHKPSSIA
jgi:hypothetical protein